MADYGIGTKVQRAGDSHWFKAQPGEIVEMTDGRVRIQWLNKDGTKDRRTWMARKAFGERWTLCKETGPKAIDIRVREESRALRRVLGCINVDANCGPRWWLVLAADGKRVLEILMLDGETAREAADRFGRAASVPADRYLAEHGVETGEGA